MAYKCVVINEGQINYDTKLNMHIIKEKRICLNTFKEHPYFSEMFYYKNIPN